MNLRRNFITWLCLVISWQVACLIFWMIGIGYFKSIIGMATTEPIHLQEDFNIYLNSNLPYYEDALFGLLFGSFFFFIHWLIENTRLGKWSFGKIILIESLLYIVAFATVFLLVAYTMSSTDIFPFEAYDVMLWMIIEYPSAIIAFGIYTVLVIILLNFFLEVSKKFGPGNLWNLFIGKYHNPVVEEKIFMFLDLKDSTGYAERLGHIRYSRLIQSCFLDLNSIVGQHNAQIYQYVGDEVVLMWDKNEAGAAEDCIQLYYGFRELLISKGDKYFVFNVPGKIYI